MSTATRKIRCCTTCSVTTPESVRGWNTVSMMLAVITELPRARMESTAVEHRANTYRFR